MRCFFFCALRSALPAGRRPIRTPAAGRVSGRSLVSHEGGRTEARLFRFAVALFILLTGIIETKICP